MLPQKMAVQRCRHNAADGSLSQLTCMPPMHAHSRRAVPCHHNWPIWGTAQLAATVEMRPAVDCLVLPFQSCTCHLLLYSVPCILDSKLLKHELEVCNKAVCWSFIMRLLFEYESQTSMLRFVILCCPELCDSPRLFRQSVLPYSMC